MAMKLSHKVLDKAVQRDFDEVTARLDALGNPPRFRVFRTAALSLANNNTIVWDTEEQDSHNWFDTTTGLYTPQLAGTYRFSWAVRPNAAITVDNFVVGILSKAGTLVRLGQLGYQRGGVAVNALGSAQLSLNGTTDTVGVVLQHNVGGTVALNVADSLDMWFDGEFIG